MKKNLDNKEFQIFKKNTILNKELEKDEIIDKCEFYGENYLFNNKLVLYKDIKKKYELCSKKNIIDLSNYIFDYNKMVIIQMGDINKKTLAHKKSLANISFDSNSKIGTKKIIIGDITELMKRKTL